MMSAEERAEAAAREASIRYAGFDFTPPALVDVFRRHLQEHARDQRHLPRHLRARRRPERPRAGKGAPMRCRHERVRVIETSDHTVVSEVDAGVLTWDNEDGPYPTNTGRVECRDCDRTILYGCGARSRARLPRWALSAIEEVERAPDV